MARTAQLDPAFANIPGIKSRKSGNAGTTVEPKNYWDGLLADRQAEAEAKRLARQAQIDADRAKRAAELLAFRTEQVTKAAEHDWFKQLKSGSVADKTARAILANFAEIDPPEGVKRTDAAIAAAIEELTDSQVSEDRSVRHGITVARTALSWAYGQVKK